MYADPQDAEQQKSEREQEQAANLAAALDALPLGGGFGGKHRHTGYCCGGVMLTRKSMRSSSCGP